MTTEQTAVQVPLIREVDGAPFPVAGTYTIDTAHTTVGFVVRHMMVSKVRGGFTEFGGEVKIAEKPQDSSVAVTVEMASIHTREPQRDAHLRSADFFDVENFPQMVFETTGVERAGSDWLLHGDLTIKGVTRPVTFDLEFIGATRDPYGNTRAGFSASGEIDRDEFGISYNAAMEAGGVVVGQKVRIEIEAETILAS